MKLLEMTAALRKRITRREGQTGIVAYDDYDAAVDRKILDELNAVRLERRRAQKETSK